jgi:hypothetical protein
VSEKKLKSKDAEGKRFLPKNEIIVEPREIFSLPGSLWLWRLAERREISSIFLLFINFKLTQNEKSRKREEL